MAASYLREPLTGHAGFDSLIAAMADERDAEKTEAIRLKVWEKFGT
jgi:hypothetical protein